MPIVIRSGRDLIFFLYYRRSGGGATSTTQNLHTGLNWHTVDPADAAVTGSVLSAVTSNKGAIGAGRVNGQPGWVLASRHTHQGVNKLFTSTSRIPSAETFNLDSPVINPLAEANFVHYSETYEKWFIGGEGGFTATSTNGVDWTQTDDDFTSNNLSNFAEDPSTGTWMVTTSGDGVWRSTNGGSNWSKVLDVTGSMGHISFAGGTWIQAGGTGGAKALRRSTDGGDTWSAGATFSGNDTIGVFGDGNGTWAYTNVASQAYQISHSTDDGVTWSISAYSLGLNSANGSGGLNYFEDKWLFASKQFGVFRWDGDITVNEKTQILEADDFPSQTGTGGVLGDFGSSFR